MEIKKEPNQTPEPTAAAGRGSSLTLGKDKVVTTYSDKSHFGRRTYRLTEDSIFVTHRDMIRGEAEVVVRLTDVSPDFEKHAVRSPLFFSGVGVALIASIIYAAIINLTKVDSLAVFPGLFLTMIFVGVFVAVATFRNQRFVRFRTCSGTPIFDVFREGPEKKRFDEFIAAIQEAIRHAKKEPNQASEPTAPSGRGSS